jgi:proteasome lid subunit RPN8/RPN11
LEADQDDLEVVLIDGAAECAEPAHMKITLDRDAYIFMKEYAHTDLSRELGGIMLGSYKQVGDDIDVHIKAVVDARYNDSKRASVRFTHQSWEYVNSIKDEYFPDLKVVGWFHTHPGFGIFLSEFDTFIQRNFFDLPWQVAFVVDPVSQKDGFFCWYQKEIVPCSYSLEIGDFHNGGYVLSVDSAGCPLSVTENANKEETLIGKPDRRPLMSLAFALIAIVCLGLVGAFSFYAGFLRGNLQGGHQVPSMVLQPGPSPQPRVVIQYLVRPGDNLMEISNLYYHDSSKYQAIADYNHLSDPNALIAGQLLKIPPMKDGQ